MSRRQDPRSASTGSVDAARNAGPRHAATDARTRTAGATVKATASSGSDAEQQILHETREQARADHAQRDAGERHRQAFAQHQTHQIGAPRAERRTNRELANALRHA